MLIVFIFGAVPSSLIVPLTVPAVAASTGLPEADGAPAAGALLSEVLFWPQLIMAMATTKLSAAKNHDFFFITVLNPPVTLANESNSLLNISLYDLV